MAARVAKPAKTTHPQTGHSGPAEDAGVVVVAAVVGGHGGGRGGVVGLGGRGVGPGGCGDRQYASTSAHAIPPLTHTTQLHMECFVWRGGLAQPSLFGITTKNEIWLVRINFSGMSGFLFLFSFCLMLEYFYLLFSEKD